MECRSAGTSYRGCTAANTPHPSPSQPDQHAGWVCWCSLRTRGRAERAVKRSIGSGGGCVQASSCKLSGGQHAQRLTARGISLAALLLPKGSRKQASSATAATAAPTWPWRAILMAMELRYAPQSPASWALEPLPCQLGTHIPGRGVGMPGLRIVSECVKHLLPIQATHRRMQPCSCRVGAPPQPRLFLSLPGRCIAPREASLVHSQRSKATDSSQAAHRCAAVAAAAGGSFGAGAAAAPAAAAPAGSIMEPRILCSRFLSHESSPGDQLAVVLLNWTLPSLTPQLWHRGGRHARPCCVVVAPAAAAHRPPLLALIPNGCTKPVMQRPQPSECRPPPVCRSCCACVCRRRCQPIVRRAACHAARGAARCGACGMSMCSCLWLPLLTRCRVAPALRGIAVAAW